MVRLKYLHGLTQSATRPDILRGQGYAVHIIQTKKPTCLPLETKAYQTKPQAVSPGILPSPAIDYFMPHQTKDNRKFAIFVFLYYTMLTTSMRKKLLSYQLLIFLLIVAYPAYAHTAYVAKPLSNINGLTNNSVNCILEDSGHTIWIGTWDGLNAYNGRSFTSFRYSKVDPNTLSNNVIRQIIEQDKHLWIATDNGINRLDKSTHAVTRYYIGNKIPQQERSYLLAKAPTGEIFCLVKGRGLFRYDDTQDKYVPLAPEALPCTDFSDFLIDASGHVVFLTFDKRLKVIDHFDKLKEKNVSIKELPTGKADRILVSGKYLIALHKHTASIFDSNLKPVSTIHLQTEREAACATLQNHALQVGFISGGCMQYDLTSGKAQRIKAIPQQTSVLSLYYGSQHIWWIGTDGQGILQLYPNNYLFSTVKTANPVRCFTEDKNHRILVGTKGSGIKAFDKQTQKLLPFLDEARGLKSMSVYALKKNRAGDIFIGSEGKGIDILYAGKEQAEPLDIPKQYATFKSVYSICFTHHDSLLWVGTSGYGLIKMNLIKEKGKYKVTGFKQYTSNVGDIALNNDIVYTISDDASGKYIWFGTRGGGLNRIDLSNNKIESLEELRTSVQLTNNDVLCLCATPEKLWIGTSYGLNELDWKENFTIKQYAEQLANKTIHGILKDEKGNIWASTNQGIFELNAATGNITDYTYNDGLHNDEFADGAYYRDTENTLFFGGVNGFTYFNSENIRLRSFNPTIVLDDLKIFNVSEDLPSRIKDGVLKLDYDERSFVLKFLTQDFIKNENCEYAYRFSNSSTDWIYMGNNPNISFAQLVPGTYKLEVKTTNGDKIWGDQLYKLTIKVGFPWWFSLPALLIYAALCLLIVYIARRVIVGRIRLSKQIFITQIEKAHEQKLYESKLDFYANVAHEFFTPLTLIYTPAQYLLEQKNLNEEMRKYLTIIKNNAERMQRLIRELVDFRKASDENLDLRPETIDIRQLVFSVTDNYVDILKENKIDFQVKAEENFTLYSDRNSLEKILFNLLSNAFKYTPRSGYVWIKTEKGDKNELIFKIRNSGNGLTENQMKEIFDRYKIFDSNNAASHGIGLNFTKRLVNILGGQITVNSIIGKYTEFLIVVPPLSTDTESLLLNTDTEDKTEENEKEDRTIYGKYANVLIVEDDAHLRQLLKDILKEYIVFEAADGKEALEKIKKTHPDIILTDIIMKGMDGFTFIQTVKNDPNISYIPLVVISAKNSMEDQIKASNLGANSYLTKPFHPLQIKSTIKNLLSRQESLRNYFYSNLSSITVKNGRALHSNDEEFIENVYRLITEHIDEEELNPAWIAESLGISKATFYRHLKEVLDKTPSEFIREIRLDYAAKLLRTTQITVSEVIYRSGFSNKSYFYREFQKQYNYSPKDYRNKNSMEYKP